MGDVVQTMSLVQIFFILFAGLLQKVGSTENDGYNIIVLDIVMTFATVFPICIALAMILNTILTAFSFIKVKFKKKIASISEKCYKCTMFIKNKLCCLCLFWIP